jgi:hypothetical protein
VTFLTTFSHPRRANIDFRREADKSAYRRSEALRRFLSQPPLGCPPACGTAPPPTPSSGSGVSDEELELTCNHDARSYVLETGYGHIAIGVDDLDGNWHVCASKASSQNRSPTACARAVHPCVPSKIRTGGRSRRSRTAAAATPAGLATDVESERHRLRAPEDPVHLPTAARAVACQEGLGLAPKLLKCAESDYVPGVA